MLQAKIISPVDSSTEAHSDSYCKLCIGISTPQNCLVQQVGALVASVGADDDTNTPQVDKNKEFL